MKTIKRAPGSVTTDTKDVKSLAKYFHQMEYKGILEDDNIYAIDQQSFRDADNVYVDWNERLVSRPTLQASNTEQTYNIVEHKVYGDVTVEVRQTTTASPTYTVVATKGTHTSSITGLTKYKLAHIEHYIICFNNVNAKVLDTVFESPSWTNLSAYCEIPILNRYVGSTHVSYEQNKNMFIPESRYDEYEWSRNIQTELPEYTSATYDNTIEVIGKTDRYTLRSANDINESPEYRLVRPLNIVDDQRTSVFTSISIAKSTNGPVICKAYSNYFEFSYSGMSFTKVWYPGYIGEFLEIASVSEDGEYFFFVASDGVYRCNLGDLTWTKFIPDTDNNSIAPITVGTTTYNFNMRLSYKFKTGDIFAFCIRCKQGNTSNIVSRLYMKGPGLYKGTDYTDDYTEPTQADPAHNYKFGYIDSVFIKSGTITTAADLHTVASDVTNIYDITRSMIIKVLTDINGKYITVITMVGNTDAYRRGTQNIIYIRGGDTSKVTQTSKLLAICEPLNFAYGSDTLALEDISTDTPEYLTISGNKYIYTLTSTIRCIYLENSTTSTTNLKFSIGELTLSTHYGAPRFFDIVGNKLEDLPRLNYAWPDNVPYRLNGGFVYQGYILANDAISWKQLNYLSGTSGNHYGPIAYTVDDLFYIVTNVNTADDDVLWTNNLLPDDIVTIKYRYGSSTAYTTVTDVVYSDNNLYMAVGKTLQITENTKVNDSIRFYLSNKNNQSFIENITALQNISTTEVAIFFKNAIKICAIIEDTNIDVGYRYDYYNTKLSTGVRLGDDVINTLEGTYTIFPTRRGLAAMNYQAFMATTDQSIEYLTDNVIDMWTKFYDDSQTIKILQWRNRLLFTNQTGSILIFDLVTKAWWRWTVPVNIRSMLTDQLTLQLLNMPIAELQDAGTGRIMTFKEITDDTKETLHYYDFSETQRLSNKNRINWFMMSQPLHMSTPQYYKNLKQLVFQFSESNDPDLIVEKSINAQIKLYRKTITLREPEVVNFKIENLRTFVKRFNYWKINEVQWALGNDADSSTPHKFELNGISIKYELGEEVR